jgi:hypothetical protein
VQTDMEHRPSARPATDGPGRLANPMDLMVSTTAERASASSCNVGLVTGPGADD